MTRTIFRSLAIDFFVRPSVRSFVCLSTLFHSVSSRFFAIFFQFSSRDNYIRNCVSILSYRWINRWRDSINILEIVSCIRRSPFSSISKISRKEKERYRRVIVFFFLKRGEIRFIAGARIRTFLIRVYKFPLWGGLISFGPLVIRD